MITRDLTMLVRADAVAGVSVERDEDGWVISAELRAHPGVWQYLMTSRGEVRTFSSLDTVLSTLWGCEWVYSFVVVQSPLPGGES